MNSAVASVVCGPYELIAQEPDSLFELADGSVELYAERSYLVKLGAGAANHVLRGALRVPRQANEGMLRFENFVGISRLGGRRLQVRSERIDAEDVDRMLDEVCTQLASLPFGVDAPTSAGYERIRELGPDALYHAFAFLRDGMRGLGPHDLPEAFNRILARPHELLRLDDPRLDPVGAVHRFDGETLEAIQSEPELLSPVAGGSPLASHPLAATLKGMMPEFVRSRPTFHSTDNPENRFVAGALDSMLELLRQFERLARDEDRVSAAVNVKEAGEFAHTLSRYRRHRVLEEVPPMREAPLQSTVLRARPGYREILRAYRDLQGRTAWGEPHDAQMLLELRDAATIYEYWCFFQVVASVVRFLGEPVEVGRFAVGALGTRVPYRYSVSWPEGSVVYNETFPRSVSRQGWPGSTSYSLSLRPDITLRTPDRLHLLDAKLKINFGGAVVDGSSEGQSRSDTFKNEDLHKMHAYRDALGADSVWVLYPGGEPEPIAYATPPREDVAIDQSFRGVGAVALRPGAGSDGGLDDLISGLL